MRLTLPLAIVALVLWTAASAPSQGFCHGCSRQRAVPTTPVGVATQTAADASADAYTQSCASQRAQLANELEVLSGRCERLGSAVANAPALRQTYNTALAAWGSLRTTCPTIGAPPSSGRATPTADTSGTSRPPTPAPQYALVSAVAGQLGVAPLVIADRAAQSVDSALAHVDSVKPAASPSQPAPAAPPAPIPVPAGATPVDSAGVGYANALRTERAYLGGFLASYAVYLAARDSKNLVGMLSAASTMGVSVDSALTSAHTAADRRHAYLQLIARALGQADSSIRARPTSKSPATTAAEAAPAATDSIKTLTPEAQATVAAAGVPADDVTVARSTAAAVTPAQMTQAASQLKSDLRATDSVRVALTARDSAAAWTVPPDLPRLIHARGLAMQSRMQAARALDDSIASVPPSGAAQAGTPATPATDSGARSRLTTWISFLLALLLGVAAGYGIRAARDPHLRSA